MPGHLFYAATQTGSSEYVVPWGEWAGRYQGSAQGGREAIRKLVGNSGFASTAQAPDASSRRGSGARGIAEYADTRKRLWDGGGQAEGRQGHARAATRARRALSPHRLFFGNIDILGAPTWGEDPRRRGQSASAAAADPWLRAAGIRLPPLHAAASAARPLLGLFPPQKIIDANMSMRCQEGCLWGGRRQRRHELRGTTRRAAAAVALVPARIGAVPRYPRGWAEQAAGGARAFLPSTPVRVG